jgi:glycosyltransferase involved in cell wall biosynthesis
LRRCLFAVVPSVVADACPVVALECAAAAKAIVASDIGGLKDLVVDGETGLLVAPSDREALRAALTRLINDDVLRARLGRAAAARRAKSFSADAIVPVVEDCYVRAMEARRRLRSSPR